MGEGFIANKGAEGDYSYLVRDPDIADLGQLAPQLLALMVVPDVGSVKAPVLNSEAEDSRHGPLGCH
jgi:hypothetical protein